jgi:hypothetical protein
MTLLQEYSFEWKGQICCCRHRHYFPPHTPSLHWVDSISLLKKRCLYQTGNVYQAAKICTLLLNIPSIQGSRFFLQSQTQNTQTSTKSLELLRGPSDANKRPRSTSHSEQPLRPCLLIVPAPVTALQKKMSRPHIILVVISTVWYQLQEGSFISVVPPQDWEKTLVGRWEWGISPPEVW